MATKKDATRTRIENIKADVGSISTCTPTTVTELQGLLGPKSEDAIQKENIRVKASQQTARKRAGGTTVATALEAARVLTTTLTPRERYILATEVANTTLKSLADTLKGQPSPRFSRTPSRPKPPGTHDAPKPSKPRSAHAKSSSVSCKPLQERSVSQVINSPQKPRLLRRSSSYSSFLTTGPDPGLVATAECARVAFAYLGMPEAKKAMGKESPELQFENGLLALVGKLVALELDNLALKEIRILKKRLDRYLGIDIRKQECRHPAAGTGSRHATSNEKESLATLLDFGDIDLNSPALPIVASLQTYLLRVIARIKRPRIVEASWTYLKLSHPSSPANLSWHLAKSQNSQAKAIRQLESLAQAILQLCPSISAPDDENPRQPSPDIVFLLQHLALKVRQRWWALAEHQGDKEKELLEPFSKCLSTFCRRSDLIAAKKYKVAESLYKDLIGSGQVSISANPNNSEYATSVNKSLSSLAQAAGLANDALHWLAVSESPDTSSSSAARKAARLARIAAVSLEASLKESTKPELGDVIGAALDALSGSLSGSVSDLDSLFIEVNGLRRIATRMLATIDALNTDEPKTLLLRRYAIRITSASIHFSTRFIGSKSLADADFISHSRNEERIIMATKFVQSTVDSVLACCKQIVKSEIQWAELDKLVQDCTCFLTNLEEQSMGNAAFEVTIPEDQMSLFAKLSNACWAIYMQLRKMGKDNGTMIAVMQRSIEVLQTRSQAEKESGLLAMKFEQLGEAFDTLDHAEGSRRAFAQCIQTYIQSGVAEAMVELTAKYPILGIFESNSLMGTLGRILKLLHRSFIKHATKRSELAFHDNLNLPSATRGAILEWQLSLYLKTLSRNRQWDSNLNVSVQDIVERLLDLYSPGKFPIRRRRVLVMLFQLSQAYPDILTDKSWESDRSDIDETLSNTDDAGLARFGDHLKALLSLQSSLRQTDLPVNRIRQSLSTWQSYVDSASSWEDVTDRVDNTEYWLQEIQAAADGLAAKGEEYLCIPILHLRVKLLELQKNQDPSGLIAALSAQGLQYLRLGYSGKAGLAFAKAEKLIISQDTSTEAKLSWHLGYAEYLLRIGNNMKCESTLSAAQSIAQADTQFMSLAKSSTALSGRLRFNRILADACYVYSLLATSNGHHKDAARFARQCVTLNRRIWAALESKLSSKRTVLSECESGLEGTSKAAFDTLSSMRNEKGIPLVTSVTHDALNGPDFWSLVPSLYRGLMQHSLVFANQGLLHEAVYVAEQAEKVASATKSRSLVIENSSCVAEYWAQSGRLDKAEPLLKALNHSSPFMHLAIARYYSAVARVHHIKGNFEEELAALQDLEQVFKELTSTSYITTMENVSPSVDTVAEQISSISLNDSNAKDILPARSTRGRKPATKTASRTAPKSASKGTTKLKQKPAPKSALKTYRTATVPANSEASSDTEQCSPLHVFQVDVIHRKALASLLQDNVSQAFEFLCQAEQFEFARIRDASHLWVRFKATLSQSIKALAQDFAFNTLPESTIAFPAIAVGDRKLSETAPPKRVALGSNVTTKGVRGKTSAKSGFVEILSTARDQLVEAHTICTNARSNHTFQQISLALGHVTVLLSAISGGDMRGSLHPLYAAYMSEIPKCNSLRLLQESVEAEQENMSREQCLQWPTPNPSTFALASAAEFQNEYIDIIPDTWSAISLGLSEARDELYITRYESGSSPFVLRLPMARHASREIDEEEFTFHDGKRNFEEIIELSDFNTRTAKDMTSKEARMQWWTEREALDTRLHELLINIENIWLGGFKGIFSQHPRHPTLLARFRKSFENILDRYLPSRKKKSQQKTSNLDARVLDLFIGLGDASNQDLDFDEALMDLIYFVVDILQFNGEQNACDEVDFDAMVIETHDALRAYHDASQNTSPATTHTILILDKNLHIFPWESLPCLEKISISRLPSLAALRERILAAKPSQSVKDAPSGHYISADAGGTSILNPSGDLSHTLKTLKPRLDGLQGSWTHIANRAPTEREFEESLRDKDLVMYFGHGSGAQFIRSKSVRRLYRGHQNEGDSRPGCATAFLFGCSSVHLSDNGIYEPSGMLASYLTAGAPAVVGMLWDVTDKDCDRFAVRAGELWGLWPESEEDTNAEAPKAAKKLKGKGKVAQRVEEVESARGAGNGRRGKRNAGQVGDDMDQSGNGRRERRRGVALDEAVREARDVCVLRYLNGAAAVVYGVPVYLE